MEPDEYEEMLLPRVPAYSEPTPELLAELRSGLRQMARSAAEDISARTKEFENATDHASLVMWEETQDVPLALLRILREVPALVDQLAAEAAGQAGEHGAGYPEMGSAFGISRQAARKRWPDVIHILTAKHPDPVFLEMAGGDAKVHYDMEEGGWGYFANGENRRIEESEDTYDTSEEAAAYAGAFLMANRVKTQPSWMAKDWQDDGEG